MSARRAAVLAIASALAGCTGMLGPMGSEDPADSGMTNPPADSGVPFDAGVPADAGFDAGSGGGAGGGGGGAGGVGGGGGAGGGGVSPVDAGVAPDLQVVFPPNCATTDAQLKVRGVTRAGLNVSAVAVGGVAATSSDGFRSWAAVVPLSTGTNTLSVDFTESGTPHSGAAVVKIERFATEAQVIRGSGGWSGRILGATYEPVAKRLIVSDDIEDGVWQVALDTGDRQILSDSEGTMIGTGYEISQPRAVVAYGNQSYIVDDNLLVGIDLTSGDRAVPLPVTFADGGAASLSSIALTDDGHIYGLSTALEQLVLIDPANSTFQVIGTQGSLHNCGSAAFDLAHHTAYVSFRYQDRLAEVDLLSGAVSEWSTAQSGEPSLSDPEELVLDFETGAIFVWDSQRLVAVDPGTGRRQLVGSGPFGSLTAVKALAATPIGPAIVDYVPSWESAQTRDPTVVVFDPVEGTRVVLSR